MSVSAITRTSRRRISPGTMSVGGAALRRGLQIVGLLLIISFGVFMLAYLAPGGVVQALLGGRANPDPATVAQIKHYYHLDDPILVQYWTWLKHALVLDLGTSYRSGSSVLSLTLSYVGVSAQIALYALVITIGAGTPLAVVSAVHRGRLFDGLIVGFCTLAVSTPVFVTGLLFLYLFGLKLGWFPLYGLGRGVAGRLTHLALPALVLSLSVLAWYVRIVRAAMIDALRSDYVAFARVRGVSGRRVLFAYAMRNAALSIATTVGLLIATFITGTVLVEVAFGLNGIGTGLVQAIDVKDVPVIQGITIVLATFVVLSNLLVDLAYGLIDPRTRRGKGPRR